VSIKFLCNKEKLIIKWTQILCCVGLVGLLTPIGMAWYIQNVPVTLTTEQENVISASGLEFVDTDCQDGTSGCQKSTRPELILCPAGVSVNGVCGQSSWSDDETPNRVCSTAGDWTWVPGFVCQVTDPYYCKKKFTTCSVTGHCSGSTTVSSSTTTTTCTY
jgi:hypothetical protein